MQIVRWLRLSKHRVRFWDFRFVRLIRFDSNRLVGFLVGFFAKHIIVGRLFYLIRLDDITFFVPVAMHKKVRDAFPRGKSSSHSTALPSFLSWFVLFFLVNFQSLYLRHRPSESRPTVLVQQSGNESHQQSVGFEAPSIVYSRC